MRGVSSFAAAPLVDAGSIRARHCSVITLVQLRPLLRRLPYCRRKKPTPRYGRCRNRCCATSSACPAMTFTSGSTPTPSQFVCVIGLMGRANGTVIR